VLLTLGPRRLQGLYETMQEHHAFAIRAKQHAGDAAVRQVASDLP
jgi:hypothetical protein